MEVLELCRRIQMPKQAVKLVMEADITEAEYRRMNVLRKADYKAFCREVKKSEDFRARFLFYFCRFACETYEDYKKEQINDLIYFDTFQDLKHWCENCYQEFGEYGIDECGWFWRLFDRTLFKLGRLQFETTRAKQSIVHDGWIIEQGEPFIGVHIPQGEPLCRTACEKSFEEAFTWFGRDIPYICHSWLLFPGLRELLSEESNIIRFQEYFQLLEVDYQEREAERRIFTKIRRDVQEYPERTTLQRRAKEYLLSGKKLGSGLGKLKSAS